MMQDHHELSISYEFEDADFDVSDEALEAAAGNARGLFCSCSGCNSACSNGSR